MHEGVNVEESRIRHQFVGGRLFTWCRKIHFTFYWNFSLPILFKNKVT